IQRDANGVITDINITWINIAQFKTRGLDFEAAYRTHLDSLGGSLSIRAIANYVDSMTLYNGVATVQGAGYVGSQAPYLVPRWRGSLTAVYEGERFGGDIRARYITASEYAPETVLPNIGDNSISARLYFDLGLRGYLPFGDNGRLTIYGNVQNLLDEKPPIASALSPFYDLVGRYFTLGARMDF
ncbi:MAG TPA: TonB-dependent receptor, partial [Steroidobacter sp.]